MLLIVKMFIIVKMFLIVKMHRCPLLHRPSVQEIRNFALVSSALSSVRTGDPQLCIGILCSIVCPYWRSAILHWCPLLYRLSVLEIRSFALVSSALSSVRTGDPQLCIGVLCSIVCPYWRSATLHWCPLLYRLSVLEIRNFALVSSALSSVRTGDLQL